MHFTGRKPEIGDPCIVAALRLVTSGDIRAVEIVSSLDQIVVGWRALY
jgi:hypothetical protein